MELKETKKLLTSQEINVVTASKRNNSDDQRVYDTFLPYEEDVAESGMDSKDSQANCEERKFGNISTLDWLQTWRSTEIS